MTLTPKNWHSFQHYKNRRPPWIKFHRTLLDDRDFQSLPVASRALAPMLWLIAAEYDDGEITCELSDIAWRLRMSEGDFEAALNPLVAKGFFIVCGDASAPPARRKQVAKPETEAEAKKEVEAKPEHNGVALPNRTASSAKQIDLEEAIAAAAAPTIARTMISEEAFTIATEILKAMGKDPFDPLSVGAPLMVQSWLNGAWPRDCIMTGVQMGMKSRNGNAPGSLKYFEKAIAQAVAQLNAPVPVVTLQPGQAYVETANRARSESLGDVARRHADAGIAFGPEPTGIRESEGGASLRLLPES